MPESALSRGLNEGAQPSSAGTTPATAPGETVKPQVRNVEELPEERAARLLVAKREAALAITPRGLEHVTEAALLEDNATVETVRAALKKAQADRFKPVGTTEPTPVTNGEERAAKQLPISDDVLVRSFENLGG